MSYIKDMTILDRFLIECDDFGDANTKKALQIDKSFNGFEVSALEHENSSFFTISATKPKQQCLEMALKQKSRLVCHLAKESLKII